MVEGLQADDVTAIGLGLIAVLVVLGFLLALVFSKIIARLAVLVVVAALAFVVWQQRTHISDQVKQKRCDVSATFFGIHVQPDDATIARCAKK